LARGGTAAALTVAGCKREACAAEGPPVDPKTIDVQRRPLGKTGLAVSDVSFGAMPTDNPAVLEHALDLGVNYIDTAACYRDGRSETTVGKVMARRRKDAVLATKWHAPKGARRQEMVASLEGSLKRLKTDHVDLIQVHSVGDPELIDNPEILAAFEEAKKRGMARFLGVTSHSPGMVAVMERALALGHYSVFLCKYNFLDYPKSPALFEKAHAAGVGVVAMKTLGGARHVDLAAFSGKGVPFARAALKWVLSNRHVSTAVISMSTFEQVNSYAAASGRKLGALDHDLLQRYAKLVESEVCRGCETCHGACPKGLPVADVMRYSMYHDQYRMRSEARRLYGELPGARADACRTCDGPCQAACAYGLPVRDRLLAADAALA